ncbi:hypothetical protein NL676_017549 [Syzygium grande]|nr:hypothetical protein NL676_017549 [Syzygium grande]
MMDAAPSTNSSKSWHRGLFTPSSVARTESVRSLQHPWNEGILLEDTDLKTSFDKGRDTKKTGPCIVENELLLVQPSDG